MNFAFLAIIAVCLALFLVGAGLVIRSIFKNASTTKHSGREFTE